MEDGLCHQVLVGVDRSGDRLDVSHLPFLLVWMHGAWACGAKGGERCKVMAGWVGSGRGPAVLMSNMVWCCWASLTAPAIHLPLSGWRGWGTSLWGTCRSLAPALLVVGCCCPPGRGLLRPWMGTMPCCWPPPLALGGWALCGSSVVCSHELFIEGWG